MTWLHLGVRFSILPNLGEQARQVVVPIAGQHVARNQ